MTTLVLGGWSRHGAVAVAGADGVRAALDAAMVTGVPGIGMAALPDPGVMVQRCLRAAGVTAGDIVRTRFVTDTLAVCGACVHTAADIAAMAAARGCVYGQVEVVDADLGTIELARRVAPEDRLLFAGEESAWCVPDWTPVAIRGYEDTVLLTRRIARALGQPADSPWRALQSLAERHVGDRRWALALYPALRADRHGLSVDAVQVEAVLVEAAKTISVALDDAASPHLGAQQLRSALAAAWMGRVGEALGELQPDTATQFGGVVGAATFVARPRGAHVLPLPDARGALVGAALLGAPPAVPRLTGLGEAFDERDVKLALESARLDYLYEPRSERLLDRVSALLSAGKLVAWFQGRGEFGDQVAGNRVVLADASDRYSRDNVNVYFRRSDLDAELTVAMTAEAAGRTFGERAPAPGRRASLFVPPAHSSSFSGAANRQGHATVQVLDEAGAALRDLLTHHERRTGRSALVMTALARPAGAPASSPADALAVTYATPVDALVIGRFLVIKDYWLLRSGLPNA